MFPLCFGKSRSRSVICPLGRTTLNAFKIDEVQSMFSSQIFDFVEVNARTLVLMEI